MSLGIDKIIVNKHGNKGVASIYISDEDGVELILNNFIIDTSDGANPVNIAKYNGVPFFSGNVIESIKDLVIDIMYSLSEFNIGIFQYTIDGLEKLGE